MRARCAGADALVALLLLASEHGGSRRLGENYLVERRLVKPRARRTAVTTYKQHLAVGHACHVGRHQKVLCQVEMEDRIAHCDLALAEDRIAVDGLLVVDRKA